MRKIIKTVKIVSSPFAPDVETIEVFMMKLHFPYSESMVTIKIDPNIVEYEEQQKNSDPNVSVRQFFVSQDTDQTQILDFDFGDKNSREVVIGNRSFEIKLLNVGKVKTGGQDFPEFEFLVTEN